MSLAKVFTPIQLAGLTLDNRIMMGSMHLALEGAEGGIDKLAAFYAERARGGVGLIVTGGAAIRPEGGGDDFTNFYDDKHIEHLRPIAKAVHQAGGKIALQLFHSGRYANKEATGLDPVAPSPLKSPISRTVPRELSAEEVEAIIQAFVDGALRAQAADYDAVEIMGSEGYLINQFLSPVTNQRSDAWGGDFARRSRFAIGIAKRVCEAVGKDYPVIFRMSGLDLIPNSTSMEETVELARMLEATGVSALNIGIGWHESKVPTVSMMVPRASFVWAAQQIKRAVTIPVIASNRINDVRLAEQLLREGTCDMVSMARPFLADAEIVRKSRELRFAEVNTCIACNQACLDHIFDGIPACCLVNPIAGRELELAIKPARFQKKVAVVGAGPAGMEAARVLSERGHAVTLFERGDQLGGQLNFARLVPGKSEFNETIRYFDTMLAKNGVKIRLGTEVTATQLLEEGFHEVVAATGVRPRTPKIAGVDLPHVVSYKDVFEGNVSVGKQAVIIGAGGIACDLSHLLLQNTTPSAESGQYLAQFGVLDATKIHQIQQTGRKITMLRRGKHVGTGLGKSTRWTVLGLLKQHGVNMHTEIEYKEITPEGVSFTCNGEDSFVAADTVILAAGSTENDQLADELQGHLPVHVIGGAKAAGELNAKRAIYEGTLVAREI